MKPLFLFAMLCSLALSATLAGPAAPSEPAPAAKHAAWLADVDYLVRRLEIQHPNLYAHCSPDDFAAACTRLKGRIPAMSDREVIFGLMELLSLITDDHTGIWIPGSKDFLSAVRLCPIGLYPFSDGIYVSYADRRYADLVGRRVLRIGNLPAEEVLGRVARLMNGDNERQKADIARLLLPSPEVLKFCGAGDSEDALRLTIQGAGGESTVEIAPEPLVNSFGHIVNGPFPGSDETTRQMNEGSGPPALWLSHGGDPYWFEYRPGDRTMYLRLKSMEPKKEEGFPAFFTRFFAELDKQTVERVVIDLRNNPGGDHYEMPLLKGLIARARLDRPDRLFLVINGGVGSAAQHFANVFAQYTNATLVGEPTGTRPNFYGAMRTFALPHHPGVTVSCSVKAFQEWDYSNFELQLVPRFEAPLSAADMQANRDPALELVEHFDAAAETVRKVREEMAQAGTQGVEALLSAYEKAKPRLASARANREMFLRDFDDRYVFPDMVAEAAFLAVAVRECPGSLTLRYRLGTSLQDLGRNEEARGCFRECLRRNPGHRWARSALALMDLEEVRTKP